MRISKKLSALGATLVLALGVAACGGGGSIPSGSVASVAGNPITLAAFNHWAYVAAKDQAAQQPGTPVIVPNDPPNFNGCLKQIHQQIPSLAKTSTAVLKKECASVFGQLKSEVMGFLIDGDWYQALAHKDGIHVSNAQVQTAFDKIEKTNFPKASALNSYLTSTGETMADLLYQVRVNQVYAKLLKREEKPVTAASIAAYYNAHKSQFGTKASANLHLVRTKSQSAAQAAYSALKSGQSWNTVAKQYSADAAGKANGGLLSNVTSGDEETAVNNAIFQAKLNKVVGPIKGTFGWYVIEVTKLTPATQQSLAKATPEIKQLIQSSSQQTAAAAVNKAAKAAFGARTLCTKTYSIPDCAGYVAPKTTTSATTTPAATATTGNSGTVTGTISSGSGTATTKTGTSTSKG